MLRILLFTACFVFAAAVSVADDFGVLVKNYNRLYSSGKADFADAEKILADLNTDGSFRGVNYSDKSRGAWGGMKHWSNLRVLLSAWNSSRKPEYRAAVLKGLGYWGKALPRNANWWWQEIGVPRSAIRVINNINGGVPRETLDVLRPLFSRAKLGMTGQNLADAAMIHLWKGVFYEDRKMVQEGVDALLSVIKIAEANKEGLQADFSFHQHGPQQQFGNYGLGFLENAATIVRLLDGTSYTVPEEQKRLIYDYFNHGMRWTLYKKRMDLLACGRQIIKNAPEAKYRKALHNAAAAGVADQRSSGNIDLNGSRYFFRSDYLIHRRNGVYFSYKMSSSRVVGGETINRENLQGLYLGCGVMQYKLSGSEYDNMPALWDWRRLPGLTAIYDNEPLNRRRHKVNTSPLVGAVTDGVDAGVVMECKSEKFSYRKSIAAVNGSVVFNLSRITGNGKSPVNTTIDSRLYKSPVVVFSGSKKQVFDGGSHELSNVTRMIHGDVAYTFLKPQNVRLEIVGKIVPWKSVTVDSLGVQQGRVFTVYIDHGKEPERSGFLSYVVSSANEACDFQTANYGCGHYVKERTSGKTFAFFFEPGTMKDISCDKPAAVMITDKNISAADIGQKNSAIKISLNGKAYKFDLPQGVYSGKSVTQSK